MRKMLVTASAGLRKAIDGRFGRGEQLTLRPLVPGLSSTLLARGRLVAPPLAVRRTVGRRGLARVRRVLPEARPQILDLRPQLRVLLAQALIVGEERRDHRSEVGDLLFELRDSAVALVLHTYV